MIRMATICSGIGAPEVASIGLPFEHIFMAEIEAFPSAVLAHHWPHVPNLGDMTKVDGESYRGKVDVLVGGTPCQAFSVAGKRESLNDERGNLTLKFVELCDAINPAYVVWENVPGVLSTADNAFGCFLGALSGNDGELFPAGQGWSNAGCVIGPRRKLAWRILDAQYFGLAQRRRRVFVVACPRDGADPCEILFEREGVQRHSAPSREKGEGASSHVGGGSHWSGGAHPALNQSHNTGGIGMSNQELFSQQGAGLVPAVAFAQNQLGEVRTGEVANTLNTNFNASGRNTPCVAFDAYNQASSSITHTLRRGTGANGDAIPQTVDYATMQVRRLTPVECERLQGFPDGYTAIPWRNKPVEDCPDGPRYKALGNSMAVPVMRWILKRVREQL